MKKLILISFLLFACSDNTNPTSIETPDEVTLNYEFWGTVPYEIRYFNETGSYISEKILSPKDKRVTTKRTITYDDIIQEFKIGIINLDKERNINIKVFESKRTVYNLYHYGSFEIMFTFN